MSTPANRYLSYWRENGESREGPNTATASDLYEWASGHADESYTKLPSRFEDVDADLSRDWNAPQVTSSFGQDGVRFASRDAWDQLRRHE